MRDWLVHIKRNENSSLQTQIREALVSAILDGQLAREEPIPSTRKMAKSLGVSRNTVVLAYQGLLDDGYLWPASARAITWRTRRLIRSAEAAQPRQRPTARPARDRLGKPLQETSGCAGEHHQSRSNWQSYTYPFIYGQVDHTLFPIAEWRDCARQALGKKWLGTWTNDTWAHDDPLLVEQIRRRILPRRGIMASDDEILITLGAQNALYLLTSLLVDEKRAWPWRSRAIPICAISSSSRPEHVALVPVDEHGLTLNDDARPMRRSSSPRRATSFRPPSPCRSSARMELLKLASQRDFIIIEDDYEFETNYVNEPCPALKSLDDEGRVDLCGLAVEDAVSRACGSASWWGRRS